MSRFWYPNELLDYIIKNNKEAVHEPGEKLTHCNTGYILLGLIIEKVCGEAYHKVLRRNIFKPLKMESTYLGAYEKVSGRFIHGYWGGKDVTSMSMSSAWSAGGIVSNNADLYKFFKALNSGRLFVKDSAGIPKTFKKEETFNLISMVTTKFENNKIIGGTGANHHVASMYYLPDKDAYILFALNEYKGLKIIDEILYEFIKSLP
jgi:CubicO group peptidase (beta-lactamase class C family)